jgi:hypothetical protein
MVTIIEYLDRKQAMKVFDLMIQSLRPIQPPTHTPTLYCLDCKYFIPVKKDTLGYCVNGDFQFRIPSKYFECPFFLKNTGER